MKLDARLTAACELVPPCQVCADIGADHGKLSAALLLQGRAGRMLVADISEKALEKAKKRLAHLRLLDRATFVVEDGLEALSALGEAPAEAICILGMGGGTLAGILRRGAHRLSGATLVLGAHTELPALRLAVCDIGYRLGEERIVEAAGRFYVLMQATPAMHGEEGYSQKELLLGPCLLRDFPPMWEWVLRRRERLLQSERMAMLEAKNGKDHERLCEAERELGWVKGALQAFADRDIT